MRRDTDTQRPSGRPSGLLLALLAALAVVIPALAMAADRAKGPAAALAYAGPTTVRAGTTLLARTPADRNIVAVTFRVDGKPFASDTVPPYTTRVLTGELAPGRHRMVVELVYRSGERRRSRPSQIDVPRRGGQKMLTVSPAAILRAATAKPAGNVAVRLLPGRYPIRELPIGGNVTLVGSGRATVLETPADDHWGGLVLKGSDITVASLAIRNASASGRGHAISVQPGSQRVMLRRLDISRARDAGVYVWGAASEITVQDSRIDGGTTALSGVIVRTGEGNDASVIRTRITRFAGYGVLFSQLRHDNRSAGLRNVALDNDIADIDAAENTDGRSKGGIWSGGALASIIGNSVTRAGWDGIETVGSSYQVVIARNTISRTRVGIYLEHATHSSVISRNVITDVRTGINVEWLYDGIGSADNQFVQNVVHHALIGIFVDYGSDRNLLSRNRFHYGGRPSIILQGASQNRVVGNVACGVEGSIVREQAADPGTGVSVRGTANVIEANTSLASCG